MAGAVAFGLQALAPEPARTTPVVIAITDLPPGGTIAEPDVSVAWWPADLVPRDAVRTVADVLGRSVTAAVAAGEPLTSARLVGPGLTASLALSGQVASPVRVADEAVTGLVRPGDRVDVIAAQAGNSDPISGGSASARAYVVASAALVVTVPAASTATVFSSSADAPTGLVLLAVSRSESLALAQAAVLGPLSLVLVD